MPLLSAYINDHAPAKARGAYNGANGMVFSLAFIVAPALGGRVYEHYGQDTLWIICGGLCAIATALFWWASRSAHSPTTSDASD
jgi:MFS family permease